MGLDRSNSVYASGECFDSHEARNRAVLAATARVPEEPRVGWVVIAMTATLALMALGMLGYLFICPSNFR